MSPPELGPTRALVLSAVQAIYDETGLGVRVRAVADKVGINVSTTHKHLTHLRAAGLVDWNDGETRTLRPL